ncbi:hypothetical protein IW147_005935 [Coemansia sp. RSA 720]|nr:hypothetical protein IW147_005935 [Coemansia sp. RSA 720]
MFTPIRLIQPQTSEQRQAIQNLVQELQRISPQLTSTSETWSDSVPFGLHVESDDSELGSLTRIDEDSRSGRHSTSHHRSRSRGSSMSDSDEWAGLDSSAAHSAMSLVALGLALVAAVSSL